jgi:hypothetical protein
VEDQANHHLSNHLERHKIRPRYQKGHSRRSNHPVNWNFPSNSDQGGSSDPANRAFSGKALGILIPVREALQLCIETGKYSLELGEIELDKPQSDGILFQRIRQRYEQIRHSVLPMRLRFSKPDKATFIKVGLVFESLGSSF